MEGEKSLLAKLRQMEEHARALTGELPAGHAQNRARLIWGLASRHQREQMLTTLREIEKQARALGEELPHGVERLRARQIAILAAHVALTLELEHPPRLLSPPRASRPCTSRAPSPGARAPRRAPW